MQRALACLQGAPLVSGSEQHPVVLFSHGISGIRTSYSGICTELSSAVGPHLMRIAGAAWSSLPGFFVRINTGRFLGALMQGFPLTCLPDKEECCQGFASRPSDGAGLRGAGGGAC